MLRRLRTDARRPAVRQADAIMEALAETLPLARSCGGAAARPRRRRRAGGDGPATLAVRRLGVARRGGDRRQDTGRRRDRTGRALRAAGPAVRDLAAPVRAAHDGGRLSLRSLGGLRPRVDGRGARRDGLLPDRAHARPSGRRTPHVARAAGGLRRHVRAPRRAGDLPRRPRHPPVRAWIVRPRELRLRPDPLLLTALPRRQRRRGGAEGVRVHLPRREHGRASGMARRPAARGHVRHAAARPALVAITSRTGTRAGLAMEHHASLRTHS